MDCQFFTSLNPKEARAHLENFLSRTEESRPVLVAECASAGIPCDYSVGSAIAVVEWATTSIGTMRLPTSPGTPDWIRQSPEFDKLNFDFDEASRIRILRVASYLGECFVRTFKELHWAIGKQGRAQANQPVINGFDGNLQMPVLLVCENMIRTSIAFPEKADHIEKALKLWSEMASK